MSKKSIQYSISMYDRENKQTFSHKFYIEPNSDYVEILKQFINELKNYDLEIDTESLDLIIVGNRNPRESRILLERVK